MSSNIALPRYPRDATNPDTPRRDGKKHSDPAYLPAPPALSLHRLHKEAPRKPAL
jgi:hypothetical protein